MQGTYIGPASVGRWPWPARASSEISTHEGSLAHRDAKRSGWCELLRNTPTPRLERPRRMFTETYRDLLETGVSPSSS